MQTTSTGFEEGEKRRPLLSEGNADATDLDGSPEATAGKGRHSGRSHGSSQRSSGMRGSHRSSRSSRSSRRSTISSCVAKECEDRNISIPGYIMESLIDEDEVLNKNLELDVALDDMYHSIDCATGDCNHLDTNFEELNANFEELDADFNENGTEKDAEAVKNEDEKQKQKKSCCGQQINKMKSTADWWSLWIGLASFSIAMILVFAIPYKTGSTRAKYVVPRPMAWDSNPLDAWDWYALVGTALLLSAFCLLYLAGLKCMGKLEKHSAVEYSAGFSLVAIAATLSLWFGSNTWCAANGLSYAIFAIAIGMLITNSPLGGLQALSCLKLTSKDGEFLIKCSLTLLATEFSILAKVGWQAVVLAWVSSPLALVLGYIFMKKVFKMETELALLTAVGATWCGASAISATATVIEASSSDITLSISVVAFFTVIFTFAQPYTAIGVGMDDAVAGAWIGASVDQTGNVIASAAIISEEATEVAGIVKIILNSGLGILCTVIAFWWQGRGGTGDKKKFSWLFLWDKFPKFVLGYFFCSGVLSVMLPLIQGTAEATAVQRAVSTMNKWWFALGFVGIGVGTNIKELWRGAKGSGVIQGYLVANLFDMGIALGLAYLLF